MKAKGVHRTTWIFPEAPHGQPTKEQQHPLGTQRGAQLYCRAAGRPRVGGDDDGA